MTIDTRRFSFDMQQIENRRFMYQPETGELILGYQFHSKQLVSSHAEEHAASRSKAGFDSFIRGWIGTGKEYMDGVIHFAPNIPRESVEAFEKAFDTLEMFGANGAKENTVVRGFGSIWEQPLNNLISFERSDRMSEQEKNYSSYAHDDLDPAKKMRIERTIYFESDKADISTLTALPLAELLQLRQESEAAEQSIYAKLQEQAYAWEQQAGNTRFIEKAIEYVKTPEVSHTYNEWKDEQYDRHVISNRVYKMQYHIYENTRYDPVKKESVPHSWHLSWSVRTNNQDGYNQGKIAGQDRKVFTDKAAMEKYLNGRIKAYSHLFTEISPPIPQEYAEYFKVNGQLLPGYTVEGEQPQQPEQAPQEPERSEQPQPETETRQQTEPEQKETENPVIADQEATPAAQPRTVVPIIFNSEDRDERVKELSQQLEKGVADVFGSGKYSDYLSAMSKFHDYSFNNALLIAMQGGTLVRGFQQWKKDFDRHVKADEKAIKILAPAPYTVKKEVDKLDPETGEPVIGKDGKPEKEIKEVTIPNFKVVSVFDVSQTEGKELPSLAVDTLSANVEQYEDFFRAIKLSSPFEIGLEPLQGAKGVCRYAERSIAINEGMSELQTIKTGIHEVSHAKMHDIELATNNGQERPDRRTREVQAESVAFMVCQHFGLDTSDYSFGYVAGWSSGKEMTELKSSLEVIQNTAKELISDIEGHFAELQKQRENVQEQTQPQVPVFDTLVPEQQKALSDEVRAMLETLVEADQKIYGKVSQGTLEAIAAQGYSLKDGQLEKLSEQPEQPKEEINAFVEEKLTEAGIEFTHFENAEQFEEWVNAHSDPAKQEQPEETQPQQTEAEETPEETAPQEQQAAEPLTDLQKKAVEIGKRYENLPMSDKIGVIAQAFGSTSGKIETSPCSGKWRGTSDISIRFDNGKSLFIGNHVTPQAKTVKVQNELINAALRWNNPEIISATKEAAISALKAREAKDNAIAAQKGLKPYTLLNVEFNDGADEKSGGYMGWYYVTIAVDDKIHAHLETGLNHDIANGKVSEVPTREKYFAAGALKETDVDYVFNNVGFSSASGLYSLPMSQAVLERAEKTLAAHKEAQAVTEEKTQSAVRYYPISETAARRANDANSYRDYRQGSATAEYRQYVDEAAAIAEKQKARVDPMYHDKIDGLLDTYARKLAENMNSRYAIDSRVPSILIAGGGNFPVRKKEKQNAARDRNHSEWQDIQGLLDKIRSTGMGGISADDPKAIEKLESKLHKLEVAQETMKAVNAYFRKHKTLDGCPHLSQENIEKLKSKMEQSWHLDKSRPFQSFALSNNNAEIRRVKERIADLSRREELTYVGWEFDGGRAEPNKADNRLQIFFDGKPSAEIREELKSNGFRWSPSAGAWQRQLNDNALYAADRIKSIALLTGERIVEIQKHARQEAAVQPKQPGQEPQQSEIPAPDPTITVKEMQEYGYSWDGMLPLQQEAAQRLFTKDDVEIYRIYEDGTEGAVTSVADLQEHAEKGGLFGIEKNTWEALYEYNAMKGQLRESEPGKEALLLYGKEDGYGIYQLSRSEATRELRFEPYDRLQAAGHSVDRANYDLVYTAPLEKDMTLAQIWEKYNIDKPDDFKGHSLSVSDIVVLHQNGENTAHYVDSIGYTQVPEFLQPQEALSPEQAMTGERVSTPRGNFHITSLNEEQMRAAGYGVHHRSEDGQYLIMGNGTQAFAVAAQPQNPLRTIEDIVEQNDNMLDGVINNTPNAPTAADLEQKMKAGEPVSLFDYARAIKEEKKQAPQKQEKKPSILKQLDDYKKQAAQQQNKQRAKEKNNDLEV